MPLPDAWLPDLREGDYQAARSKWSELTRSEKDRWLLKVAFLGGLALTIIAHPSSAVRDIAVWGSFFYVLFTRRKALLSRKPDRLSLAILTYTLIVAASAVYSAHRHWSVKDAWKFSVVLAMVFAGWHLFKNRAFLVGCLQLLVLSSLIVSVYEVAIYVNGLGREWHWGERWVYGPYYGHPNTTSAIIMLLLPISLFLLVTSRNLWLRVMHGCFIGTGLFLIYVMASRTAQLSLVGMILCGTASIRPRRRRIIAVTVAVCMLVFGFLNVRALNPRFLDKTVRTLTFREENWRNLSKLIARRPIFGYGYGKKNYQTVYHRSFVGSVVPYQHAHSLLLQTAFETGAIGLGAMMWLWVVTVTRLFKGYSASDRARAMLFACLLVSFLGISIYCLAEVPDGFLRSLSWLLVAMTGALTGKQEKKSAVGQGADLTEGTTG